MMLKKVITLCMLTTCTPYLLFGDLSTVELFPDLDFAKQKTVAKSVTPTEMTKALTPTAAGEYQANIIEKTLRQCHNVRKVIEGETVQKNTKKAFGFCGNVLHYASAVFEPVLYAQRKAVSFLHNQTFNLTVKALQFIDPWINPPAKTKREAMARRQNTLMAAKGFGDLVKYVTKNFASVNGFISAFSNKILTDLQSVVTNNPQEQLAIQNKIHAEQQRVELLYANMKHTTEEKEAAINKACLEVRKEEISKRLFANFEGQLPKCLQNGRAYECYKYGKKAYDFSKGAFEKAYFAYQLLDDLTAISSLCYQTTPDSKVRNESFSFSTIITNIDVLRRCARSYLNIVEFFNLKVQDPKTKEWHTTPFQKVLWVLVKAVGLIIPLAKKVTTIDMPAMPNLPPMMPIQPGTIPSGNAPQVPRKEPSRSKPGAVTDEAALMKLFLAEIQKQQAMQTKK